MPARNCLTAGLNYCAKEPGGGGGGGEVTPLQEANRDVPLDGLITTGLTIMGSHFQ